MKIIVTGSLGHISRPLAQELVEKGHSVTVISSKPDRQQQIEAMGAAAAIGTVEDVDFITKTFTGADAVYCMLPPPHFADPNIDVMAHTDKVVAVYAQAILQSGVKRVVYLSSIGAHTNIGNGILAFHYNAEQRMGQLPANVAITFMRPVGFYYNLFAFVNGIKTQGVIASNYGGDDMAPWVSPIDIAAAVAEEIVTPLTGRKVVYVASEEITCNNIASILGEAIGKPDLKWIVIASEQLLAGMKAFGMNAGLAEGLVEMNGAIHNGSLYDDYYQHRPTLGKVKVKDFAKDFAAVYNQNS